MIYEIEMRGARVTNTYPDKPSERNHFDGIKAARAYLLTKNKFWRDLGASIDKLFEKLESDYDNSNA